MCRYDRISYLNIGGPEIVAYSVDVNKIDEAFSVIFRVTVRPCSVTYKVSVDVVSSRLVTSTPSEVIVMVRLLYLVSVIGGSVISDALDTKHDDSIAEMKVVGTNCWVMVIVAEVVTCSVKVKILMLEFAGPQNIAEVVGQTEVLFNVNTLGESVLNGTKVVFGTEIFGGSVLKGVDVMFSTVDIVAATVEDAGVVPIVVLTATRLTKRKVESP